jgi:peptide chain release factor 3
VKFRILAEYGVNVNIHTLPFSAARWVNSEDPMALETFKSEQVGNICLDQHQNPTLLMDHEWRIKYHQQRHPKITFTATSESLHKEGN